MAVLVNCVHLNNHESQQVMSHEAQQFTVHNAIIAYLNNKCDWQKRDRMYKRFRG